jgi:hypothetical protein
MLQIFGYSITYQIAKGKQQGQKVFTLQVLTLITEQRLASSCASNVAGSDFHAGVMSNAPERVDSKGCAVTYFEESLALGYQKKGWQ